MLKISRCGDGTHKSCADTCRSGSQYERSRGRRPERVAKRIDLIVERVQARDGPAHVRRDGDEELSDRYRN